MMTKKEMVYAMLRPQTEPQRDYADRFAQTNTKAFIEFKYKQYLKGKETKRGKGGEQ